MRPVKKGDWPTDDSGKMIEYKKYEDARGELIKRLGEYCSYCEMHLDTSLAVEHILPKKPEGVNAVIKERELDWGNFLLSCTNCNSIKGDKDINLKDYFWPHLDNTFRAFSYSESGSISPSDDLLKTMKKKASDTIALTGLDRNPSSHSSASDRRWLNRRDAWGIAQKSHKNLRKNDSESMRDQIVFTAIVNGYWSIWMTVFTDDLDMERRLIEAFQGTAADCFDASNGYKPVARIGGQV